MKKQYRLDHELVQHLASTDSDINEHLILLFRTAIDMKARTIVELGAGQSTYVLAVAASEMGGKLYTVDTSKEGAYERGFKTGKKLLDGAPYFIQIIGDSVEVGKTWSKSIDFLFIDTDHAYEHVKKELELWPQYVRDGGKIAMHDTLGSPEHTGAGQALKEFLTENDFTVTHYSDTKRNGMSILVKE